MRNFRCFYLHAWTAPARATLRLRLTYHLHRARRGLQARQLPHPEALRPLQRARNANPYPLQDSEMEARVWKEQRIPM